MNRDLDFLYEIGALRLIPRQWQRFHLPGVANVTEHHYRVMWLALVIAAHENQGDSNKILKMAMVHDVAESRTNDVDYLSRQYVKRDEQKAIRDIFNETSLSSEFTELIEEYEKRESIEAKIVKDADNLDVSLELRELGAQGNDIEKGWRPAREKVAQTQLYTKTAKLMHKEIVTSDPHNWHINSPGNRLNSGDWKENA